MTPITDDPRAIGANPRVMPGMDLANDIAGHIICGLFSIGMIVFIGWLGKVAAETGFQMPFYDEDGDMGWALFLFGNVAGVALAGLFHFLWWLIFRISQTKIAVGANGVSVSSRGSVDVFLWNQIVRVNQVTLITRPKGGAAGAMIAAMDYELPATNCSAPISRCFPPMKN